MEFPKNQKNEDNSNFIPSVAPPQPQPQDIRNILDSLTKDQLINIIQSATLAHRDVLDAVYSVADLEITRRSLFIRGLAGETTRADLRDAFSAFGPLEEVIVAFENDRSRSSGYGYGFVTFKNVEGAVMALKEPSKKIKGRMTVAQFASDGDLTKEKDVEGRKIYVGNAPLDVSAERLLSYFERFGEVEEGPIGFEKVHGESNDFAFFVYKSEESARASLVEPFKVIDGHEVYCGLAEDGKKVKPMQMQTTLTQEGFSGDGISDNDNPFDGIFQGKPPYY